MDNFCASTAEIWQLVGHIVTILKIAIPLIIIVLAVIDLGKAAISSKDDEMKKAFSTLIRRVIAGVLIFFIPTLVSVVFSIINGFSEVEDDFNVCVECITSPGGTDCEDFVADSEVTSESE